MKGIRRKYYASLLILISVLALSSKDTLQMGHRLLHMIPNPFHYHGIFHHHHHDNDSGHHHVHDLSDHVQLVKEAIDLEKTPPLEKKESQSKSSTDLKLFFDEYLSISFERAFSTGASLVSIYIGIEALWADIPLYPPPQTTFFPRYILCNVS